MLPGYRYMDSYPQPHHFSYFPAWDEAWKQNLPKPPATGGFGHWSEYPSPMEYPHGFCYPYCPPSYYPMRPPHSHLPPSHYFPYHGPYPPCGGGFYPPPYHAPLHYPVEHSVYDRHKDKERHCCGCPNHACKEKEDKGGVRIEEEKGNKDNKDSCLSNRYPYPWVWCPPEYLKDKATDKPSGREQEKLGGWYPSDMMPKPQEDEKNDKIRDRENDKKSQYPFPFFLIPGFDKLKELKNDEPKVADTSPKPVEEQLAKLKIIPVNPCGDGDCGENPPAVEVVKDSERNNTKENHVKRNEEQEKKAAESQTSSPRKSSKLPPVCLRVDPLRRRKNGSEKSTSRSPSPPGEKSKETKATTCSGPVEATEQVASAKKPEEEKKVREIEVKEAKDEVDHSKEEKAVEGTEARNKVEEKSMKKQLSTTEAAVLIQSFYRGHEVRKWEPLKKLKQIAKVSEQVNEVRKKMQALESSVELQKEGKQRVLISESIMSLLLQLDTIQGLHPSVRDIRKAVAKELVYLQERLDSLAATNVDGEAKNEVTHSSEDRVQQDAKEIQNESGVEIQQLDEVAKEFTGSERLDSSAPTNAGGETKTEVTHSTENCVQHNATDQHELPEPLVKEVQNESSVEIKQSDEVAKEFTESEAHVECIRESCTSQTPVSTDNVETNTLEVESVQKMNGVQGDAAEETNKSGAEGVDVFQEKNVTPGDGVKEPIGSSSVVDGKVGSEVEEPAEASKGDGSYEKIGGNELGFLGVDSFEMQNTHEPGAEHVVNELLQAVEMDEDRMVQELPVEDADFTQSGTENVVQELICGVACGDHEAKHSPEEQPLGGIDGNQLDAEDVHEKSQGVLNAEISELQEVQPQGLSGALDASEVVAKQAQECQQTLAPDAVPYPNTHDNKEHGVKDLNGMPLHEIVGSDPTRKEDGVGDVPEADNGPMKELVHDEKTPCPGDDHIDFEHTSSTDCVAVCQEEWEKTIAVNENVVSNSDIYEADVGATKTDKHEGEAEVAATNINKHESSCLGSIENDQEVDMKEEEVITTNKPLRVEAEDRKLLEENEKLREMIGKLLNEGKQQMTAISDLHGRVKDLERKLTKKKKLKMRSQRPRKQALLSELGG